MLAVAVPDVAVTREMVGLAYGCKQLRERCDDPRPVSVALATDKFAELRGSVLICGVLSPVSGILTKCHRVSPIEYEGSG